MLKKRIISEWIIDGVPGVGKTTLMEKIYKELVKRIKEGTEIDATILLNGALPEENKDEFILSAPVDGEISFIQKRYDPDHCYKDKNIHSILNFHETNYENDAQFLQKVKEQYSNSHILNIKERDGPSSAIIFNQTTFEDLVCSQKNTTYWLSLEEVMLNTHKFLRKWMEEIKEHNIHKHFVYLKATPEFSYERVKKRNRQYEAAAYSLELSSSLVNSYDNFFSLDRKLPKLFDLYDKKITTLQKFNAADKNLYENITDLIVDDFYKCSK